LRSEEAKARLAELEELIEERSEQIESDAPASDRPHFTKRRPLPLHAGRAKH